MALGLGFRQLSSIARTAPHGVFDNATAFPTGRESALRGWIKSQRGRRPLAILLS